MGAPDDMVSVGYFLACEEFGPRELVRQARLAEEAGFERLWISDHFHPWTDAQGHSPFVWSVIGALSEAVSLPITTAVTCPTVRIHPAIIAQAAATTAVQLEGRFVLGVGSGEALNSRGHRRRRLVGKPSGTRPRHPGRGRPRPLPSPVRAHGAIAPASAIRSRMAVRGRP